MDTKSKKVLLISYTFPPSPGIGGRRWVKFAKHLHEKDIDIRVLTTKNTTNQKSQWIKDLDLIQNKISYLNSNYPKKLGQKPENLIEKLLYRIIRSYCRIKFRGNYYDKSAHWSKGLLPIVEKEIKNGYNNIIITCAPFKQAYDLTKIKINYPDINLIIDFRDPWVQSRSAYGFNLLSKKRQSFEEMSEKRVIEKADYIISVSEDMSAYFSKLTLPLKNNKFITIPNGFDKEELPLGSSKHYADKKLRFIFTGTIYNDSMHLFDELIMALTEIQNNSQELYNLLQFDFYGSAPDYFIKLIQKHKVINFNGKIPLAQVHMEIMNSDICMLFLSDDLNYSLSTKFYEYIAMNKPIASFSLRGKTNEFIEQNKIGYAVDKNNIKDSLLIILADYQKNLFPTVSHFDTSQFEISNLTNNIIKLLK